MRRESLVQIAGACLAVASLTFLAARGAHLARDIDFGPRDAAALALLCFANGSAAALLARAWQEILAGLGATVTARWALVTYGLSQAGKYLPGNAGHLLGRQVMAMASGIEGSRAAKSIAIESVLIGALGASFIPVELSRTGSGIGAIPLAVATTGVILVLSISAHRSRHFAVAALWQVAWLAAAGTMFALLCHHVASEPTSMEMPIALRIGATYLVAWLAGMLSVGAPAGIGVREATLLLLLRDVVPEAELLRAIVLARLGSLGGDAIFFAIAGVQRIRAGPPPRC